MIRNEKEYQEAVKRLTDESRRLDSHKEKLEQEGLKPREVERVLEPLRSFHLQLEEEVESYERLKRGDLGELVNLSGLGRILVCLRIARDITQKELAKRLKVHESQVSRDERNEYHGITVERANRILEAMDASLRSSFATPVFPDETPELQEA